MHRYRLVALATLLACGSAFAQWTNSYGYSFNNPISASINQMMWDNVNRRMLLRSMLKKKGFTDAQIDPMSSDQMLAALGGAKKAAESSKVVVTPGGSKFKPASKRLVVNDLAAALTKDQTQQAALRELFNQGLKAYEAEASKDGFQNDLAGAMAFFLGSAYYVWHDGTDPDENGLTLVARQLQQIFDTPEMKKAADADKQKLYELLIGMATWLGVSWQSAVQEKDEALKAQLKEAAGGVLKGYLKLDPAKVKITATGLTIEK